MSGPKVVRIVTREEIIEICEGHLARLAQTLAHWSAQGQRLGQLGEAQVEATRLRHQELAALLVQDRFLDLQKDVPLEIEFLKRDLLRLEEAAVSAALDTRQLARRAQENAGQVLRTLQTRKITVDAELFEQLEALARGDKSVAKADAALAQAFSLLAAPPQAEVLSAQQIELAKQLRAGVSDTPVPVWRAQSNQDPRLVRIDRHIAELETLDGPEAAADFIRRASLLDPMEPGPRRNMLMDSLVLDLASAASARTVRETALDQLRTLQAELLRIDNTESLRAEVKAAIDRQDIANASALEERCKAAIAEELKRVAAIARRVAVLNGLASLGYEVREGMETAWAEQGRVALRKTATPGYGVEVGGAADTGRLQVRAVSFDSNRDPSRDRDVETIWCGEFTRLQKLLAESGDTLEIEKALAIGAVPLKVIAGDEPQAVADVAAPLERRL